MGEEILYKWDVRICVTFSLQFFLKYAVDWEQPREVVFKNKVRLLKEKGCERSRGFARRTRDVVLPILRAHILSVLNDRG